MGSFKRTISQNLRRFRKEKEIIEERRIPHREVAEAIHKSRTAYAKMELAIQLPDAEDLFFLAQFFNKPIEEFYGTSQN